MLLGMIKVAFCLTIAAIVVETDYVSGMVAYVIGAVLVTGAVLLFNAGCRVAHGQGEQKGAQAALRGFRDRLLQSGASHNRPTRANESDH